MEATCLEELPKLEEWRGLDWMIAPDHGTESDMHKALTLCAFFLLPIFGPFHEAPTGRDAHPQESKLRLAWRLPGYCYLKYQRGRSGSRSRAIGTRVTAGLYSHEILKGRQVRFSRYDLADLMPMLALSLSGLTPREGKGANQALILGDCIDTDRLSVKGSVKTLEIEDPRRIQQEGRYRVVGTEKPKVSDKGAAGPGAGRRKAPPGRATGKKYIKEAVIEFKRVVDTVTGRVHSFEGKIRGSYLTHKGAEPREFTHGETWRFQALIEPDTAAFRKLVNDAIDQGQDWLARHTRGTPGQQALALLTLCKNNPHRDSEAVQELLEAVRSSRLTQTYELAVSIQALESYYESPNESARLRRGEISEPSERRLSPDDRALMSFWLKRLLANRSPNGGDRWRFHYVSDAGFDNSNTQFASLGLQAAERCGLKVPKETWTGLALHFLRESLDGGREKTRIRLTSYRELARRKKAGKKTAVTSTAGVEVRVKGFNYHKAEGTSAGGRRMRIARDRNQPAYGSMTCAGVTGLTIAEGALTDRRKKSSRLLAKISSARMAGFAWLHHNYDVRRNPGRGQTWYLYYLYSLERTCELGGVARIQNKNWYFDGAMQILTLQDQAGSFHSGAATRGGLVDTCLAILFLKRAIAPVTTHR